jgi:hypothetical protein
MVTRAELGRYTLAGAKTLSSPGDASNLWGRSGAANDSVNNSLRLRTKVGLI